MILKIINNVKNKSQCRIYCTKVIKNNKLYSSTVLLPKTKFPLKLDRQKLLDRDEFITNTEEFKNLYNWQKDYLTGPEFVLHDGPPYANGALHMGHAINKILKDIILRCNIIQGRKVHFVPGWDCHGLPIELKALTTSDNLTPIQIRQKARNFATKTLEDQKKVFESWGIIGDWKNCYTTCSKDYVKNQFNVFYELFSKNLVYRDVKPVYWSPSSKTALAEAELEYNESHKSKSVYVRFKIKDIPQLPNLKDKRVFGLIWTTTPWTLPANQAVCYNKNLMYALLKKSDPLDTDIYIAAVELLEDLSKNTNCNFQLLTTLNGEYLDQTTYFHPMHQDQVCSFLNGAHVLASKGTGLVHTAPAHGPEDFLVALNNNFTILDLVDETGCYNDKAGHLLAGKSVLNEGTNTVLDIIKENIVYCGDFIHSYPYDWRTKQPVIIRASKQWFMDTSAIKNKAVECLNNVKVIPKSIGNVYKNNLITQLLKRPYWCISRQRKWGVPIPVLYDIESNAILNKNLLSNYCELLEIHGTDFWWKLSDKELLGDNCTYDTNQVQKGQDILDIWFDSGISWSKVLQGDKVADMCLEGVDQFNGWFQSSLMTSVALREKAPYKTLYVHGFAVDEKGVKMSKSVGNVIDPIQIMKGTKSTKPLGVDTLRWWVACHANQDPIAFVSNNVLETSSDEVQKIRSVLRFALGSLHDYEKNEEVINNLFLIDKYLLHLLYEFYKYANEAREEYQFQKIGFAVINLLTNPVSALYYTAVKDRLYCEQVDSLSRRTVQFILLKIFEVVSQFIAPIVPHLIEEVFMHLPQKENKSFFTTKHCTPEKYWFNQDVENIMTIILNIKKDINKEIGAGTANVVAEICLSSNLFKTLTNTSTTYQLEQEIIDILQISQATIKEDTCLLDGYRLKISKSSKYPCPRCRRVHSVDVDELCTRCNIIVDICDKQKITN